MRAQKHLGWWLYLLVAFLAVLELALSLPLGFDHSEPSCQSSLYKPGRAANCSLILNDSATPTESPRREDSPQSPAQELTLWPSANSTVFTLAQQSLAPSKTRAISVRVLIPSGGPGGPVPPSWFYGNTPRTGPRVSCLPPRYVYNNIIPHNDFPGVPAVHYYDFPDWRGQDDIFQVYALIRRRQAQCGTCACDEDGRIVARPPKVLPERESSCPYQGYADRCSVVFACICIAKLQQPTATETGLTIDDYQRAIDGIPDTIKLAHKGWSWKMHGLNPEPGQSLTWSNYKTWLHDPGIKEPYSVEGPSDRPTWNWLSNLNALSGGSLAGSIGGGGLGFRKRNVPDAAGPTSVHVQVTGNNITIA